MADVEGAKRHPARLLAHVLVGVSTLLLLSLGGEILVAAVGLPLPGSVIGLVALVLVLLSPLGDRVEKIIGPSADLLIGILPLLLVPLAVGVIDLVDLVGGALGGLVVCLIVGWLIAAAVTAAVYLPFRRRAAR